MTGDQALPADGDDMEALLARVEAAARADATWRGELDRRLNRIEAELADLRASRC